jgi:hypothetical protein
MSTKETVQGSCSWGSCVVVFVVVSVLSPAGAADTLFDGPDGCRGSHMPRPKRTGYRRLRKRFFQLRCLT